MIDTEDQDPQDNLGGISINIKGKDGASRPLTYTGNESPEEIPDEPQERVDDNLSVPDLTGDALLESLEGTSEEPETQVEPEAPLDPQADLPEDLDLGAFFGDHFEEFARNGTLSEETIKALAAKHNTNPLNIRGRLALAREARQQAQQAMFQAAGGPEAWTQIKAWAEDPQAISEEDRARLNRMMTNQNSDMRLAAIVELKARHAAATASGQRPPRRGGPASPGGTPPKVADFAQVQKLMGDPRYNPNGPQYDKVYAARVDSILRRSADTLLN